jgi:hypothetical protein
MHSDVIPSGGTAAGYESHALAYLSGIRYQIERSDLPTCRISLLKTERYWVNSAGRPVKRSMRFATGG